MYKFIENNLVKKERSIDNIFNKFIDEPFNPIICWKLGVEYEDNNQKAAAIQYYLRCAENTEDNFFASEEVGLYAAFSNSCTKPARLTSSKNSATIASSDRSRT